MTMYWLIRKLLFILPPEVAHLLALKLLKLVPKFCFSRIKPLPCHCMGLDFPNPVGLAAGLDKNGDYIDALAKLGFGFIEIGTVTPKPQSGNPQPRLFRLSADEALINRMGFNNKGVEYLISQVKKSKYQGILGINIGKNAATPIENAAQDYLICMQQVYRYASYIVINISSPNTPDLRNLQFDHYLGRLLSRLKEEQSQLANRYQRYVPLVVKISPDLNEGEISEIANTCLSNKIDAIIATNTTVSRRHDLTDSKVKEGGGLSGKPLQAQSTQIIKILNQAVDHKIPIIGVGGIMDGDDAKQKHDAGASLVQIYTGFIYKGPSLIKDVIMSLHH